ncbi:MAG: hypothetical protein ACRDNS_14575, partial [Trebonia sp.]
MARNSSAVSMSAGPETTSRAVSVSMLHRVDHIAGLRVTSLGFGRACLRGQPFTRLAGDVLLLDEQPVDHAAGVPAWQHRKVEVAVSRGAVASV